MRDVSAAVQVVDALETDCRSLFTTDAVVPSLPRLRDLINWDAHAYGWEDELTRVRLLSSWAYVVLLGSESPASSTGRPPLLIATPSLRDDECTIRFSGEDTSRIARPDLLGALEGEHRWEHCFNTRPIAPGIRFGCPFLVTTLALASTPPSSCVFCCLRIDSTQSS